MRKQRPPTESGVLLTPAALVKIFQDELRGGPIPTEHQLAALSSMTVPINTYRTNDVAVDFVRDVGVPLYDDFCSAVDEARNALGRLQSQIPRDDWNKILQRTPGLPALQAALEETAAFIRPPVAPQSKRGQPEKRDQHLTAWGVAEATQAALQAAGHTSQISITSDSGPVARIGSRILATMLGLNVLPSATFADWVGKHLGHYPHLTD